MDLASIVLSEISQRKMDTVWFQLHITEYGINTTKQIEWKRNKVIDIKTWSPEGRGWRMRGKGKGDREGQISSYRESRKYVIHSTGSLVDHIAITIHGDKRLLDLLWWSRHKVFKSCIPETNIILCHLLLNSKKKKSWKSRRKRLINLWRIKSG